MTVLVLSHMFPNERDPGAGIFVLEQIKALRAAGATVLVISPTPWAPEWLKFLPSVRKYAGMSTVAVVDGFIVERPRVPTFPKKYGFAFSGFLFYLSCRRAVARLLRLTKIDVIHANTLLPDGFAAVLLGRRFHLPVVCTAHGSDVNVYPSTGRLVRWATQWALRHLERVIMVSEDLKAQAIALGGDRDLTVVHNGADNGTFRPAEKHEARTLLGLPDNGKIVCFVGYLRPEKGIQYLLEAFARLPRPDVHLCLVGDGPLKQTMIVQAEHLGILDRCVFAGQKPHGEIPLWLSAADCLVLCSLSEGLPTILPEAMLSHVPIIATPVGGIPEIIHDGQTGLLVPCMNPPALADAMTLLLSQPDFAQAMADRAETMARSTLTWYVNAQKTEAVYEDAISAAKHANGHQELESRSQSTSS